MEKELRENHSIISRRAENITNNKTPSRRSFIRGLGVATSALALPGSALASKPATPTQDIEVHRNLTFAERPDVMAGVGGHVEDKLQLDLYLPEHEHPESSPVIVFIHGGAWLGGSKDDEVLVDVCSHFARQGFAVASIEYRLIPEATFPAQILDVNAAVRWVRASADEYGLDPANIGTFGVSAGGHLAALAGVTNEVDEFKGDGPNSGYSSEVQAAVSWFGIMALHKMAETAPPEGPVNYEGPNSPESMLVGETIADNPEAGKYASPISYFDQGDPPLLLYHGKADGLVGYGQSELMYEKARDLCHDTTFYLLDGLDHGTEIVYPALRDKPPAEATVRTVHCRPSENAPNQRTKDGPVASLTDMGRFFRKTLRD